MKVIFDEKSANWECHNEECNIYFIRQAEQWFNQKLSIKGYVTIIEILEHFCISFDINHYLNKRFDDLVWLHDKGDVITIGMEKLEDGSILLDLNIDPKIEES